VTAFFLVSEEGSDPPIMDVLGIKASEAHHIVDPHIGVQVVEDDMTNVQRLVERYLTKSSKRPKSVALPVGEAQDARASAVQDELFT